MLLTGHKAREMGRIETEQWGSDWELTGSPLYQRHVKPEPLWSCHASIETIKNSPRTKLSQDQLSGENSRFFTLDTAVRGPLFPSNDTKKPLHADIVGGDDHALPADSTSPATTSLVFAVSPRASETSQRHRSSRFPKDSQFPSITASSITEEAKECAGDTRQAGRNHEETISRYEKLRNERLKIRHKIAQRKVGRREFLNSDSIASRRKSIESLDDTVSPQDTSPTKYRSRDRNDEDRSNAAIRIQASARRVLALKILTAKKAARQEADSKRLQQCSSQKYSWNRTARTNNILEKIKARELHHVPYQLGHLYTIYEE